MNYAHLLNQQLKKRENMASGEIPKKVPFTQAVFRFAVSRFVLMTGYSVMFLEF